jgi:hypothetical protein
MIKQVNNKPTKIITIVGTNFFCIFYKNNASKHKVKKNKNKVKDVRAKLPLQKSSSTPATAPENSLMAPVDIYITDQLGTPSGRYDEHSSSFPLVRNQGFIVQ